ncbi:MAG TPA: DinB family protein [Planctomycetaceae bacterium]|nr:DinB family protein [Planctomycetaceae bacterium]
MSTISVYLQAMEFNRTRTLATLDDVAKQPQAQAVLGYRPGPGRAHIAWQLMHIGITEELFATERLFGRTPAYSELVPRFKGGSTPDDDIPSADLIRRILNESRQHLIETLRHLGDECLQVIPEAFKARNFTFHDVLHILAWHEPHHQGQAHITFNLYKASLGKI